MNTFELEGWQKGANAERSEPLGLISFRISDEMHLKLERLEESMQAEGGSETYLDCGREVDITNSDNIRDVSDWRVRVFLSRDDVRRGMFHLVGQRHSDQSVIYSNTVMVDQLG